MSITTIIPYGELEAVGKSCHSWFCGLAEKSLSLEGALQLKDGHDWPALWRSKASNRAPSFSPKPLRSVCQAGEGWGEWNRSLSEAQERGSRTGMILSRSCEIPFPELRQENSSEGITFFPSSDACSAPRSNRFQCLWPYGKCEAEGVQIDAL
jgi:hypothetical protein